MSDARRRSAERKFLADPADPALLDAAVVEARRAGQPVLELLVARRRSARELVEPKLRLEVFAHTPEGPTDIFHELWGRVATVASSDEVGTTPGRVKIPACNQWYVTARPAKLTPALAAFVHAHQVPGLNLDQASGLKGEELASLAGAEALASLSFAGCWRLDGAHLASINGLPRLDTLDLMGCKLKGKDLEPLVACPRLVRLSLGASPTLADDDLRPLGGTRVEVLSLAEAKSLTDAALAHLPATVRFLDLQAARKLTGAGLSHLTELARLSLRRCERVTPAAVEELSRLPRLRELDLSFCSRKQPFARPQGLAPLERLVGLEALELENLPALDATLPDFGALPALRRLSLSCCRELTDAALATLRGHPALEDLELDGVERLTPDGLRHLHALPALRRIMVSAERRFDAAVEALREATPSLGEVDRF